MQHVINSEEDEEEEKIGEEREKHRQNQLWNGGVGECTTGKENVPRVRFDFPFTTC